MLNDKWLGDFYHATDRTKSRNLVEEGLFYGVQQGPRAIGLYTPRELEILKGSSNAEYHYNGSAKILGRIGKAFADATTAMIESSK